MFTLQFTSAQACTWRVLLFTGLICSAVGTHSTDFCSKTGEYPRLQLGQLGIEAGEQANGLRCFRRAGTNECLDSALNSTLSVVDMLLKTFTFDACANCTQSVNATIAKDVQTKAAAFVAGYTSTLGLKCDSEELAQDFVAAVVNASYPVGRAACGSGESRSCGNGDCAATWQKCGGRGMGGNVKSCCEDDDSCVKKNSFFSQCRPSSKATPSDWSGQILMCQPTTPRPDGLYSLRLDAFRQSFNDEAGLIINRILNSAHSTLKYCTLPFETSIPQSTAFSLGFKKAKKSRSKKNEPSNKKTCQQQMDCSYCNHEFPRWKKRKCRKERMCGCRGGKVCRNECNFYCKPRPAGSDKECPCAPNVNPGNCKKYKFGK